MVVFDTEQHILAQSDPEALVLSGILCVFISSSARISVNGHASECCHSGLTHAGPAQSKDQIPVAAELLRFFSMEAFAELLHARNAEATTPPPTRSSQGPQSPPENNAVDEAIDLLLRVGRWWDVPQALPLRLAAQAQACSGLYNVLQPAPHLQDRLFQVCAPSHVLKELVGRSVLLL